MINYKILDDSIKFYETLGFQRIESPWTVSTEIADITKPDSAKNFSIEGKNKVLVASGEQSFLYLYNKGFLPKGKFQTITPCFRDESFGLFHTKYFIKNELIITDEVNQDKLAWVGQMAQKFFLSLGLTHTKIVVTSNIAGEESFDIFYRDIELGSYGIRSCNFLNWIYGTGFSDPRFSRVLSLSRKDSNCASLK